jgi:hypothetical protein
MTSSSSDLVRSMMTGGSRAIKHMCSLKTRRVVTVPQQHLEKSFLNSNSDNPGLETESNLRSWSKDDAGALLGGS